MCYFAENAREFDLERDRRTLEAKLYAVLATGQQDAFDARLNKAITPSNLFAGFNTFWTGLWPLCPKKPPRAPGKK
jgi:hypothetical protein